MEVILLATKRRIKKKVIRDHYWYDPNTRKRIHLKGGQLVFSYDPTLKITTPKVVDSEEWVYESNYDEILKWANLNNVEILQNNAGYNVVIDIRPEQLSEIESDLYRHKIAYDYNEHQLQKESTDSREKKKWQNSQSRWPIHLFH